MLYCEGGETLEEVAREAVDVPSVDRLAKLDGAQGSLVQWKLSLA